MTCGICATKIFSLVRHKIQGYEMENIFNMLDHLLASMIYTVILK